MEFPGDAKAPGLPVLTDIVDERVELVPVMQAAPVSADELAQQVMARLEGLLQARMTQMLEGVVETLITEQSAQVLADLRPELQALVLESTRQALRDPFALR